MKEILCTPINGIEKNEAISQMLSVFQGEENMEKKFPKAYEALNSAPENDLQLMSKNQSDDCRMRVVHVAYTNKDHNELLVRVLIESKKTEGYDVLKLTIYDKKTGTEIISESKMDFTGNNNWIDVIFPLKERSYENVIVEARLNKLVGGLGTQHYMATLSLGEFEVDVDAKFDVKAPKARASSSKCIKIAYYPISEYDYLYEEARKSHQLYIPNEGSITFDKEEIVMKGIDTSLLAVAGPSGPPKRHSNRSNGDVYLPTTSKIEWKINENWGLNYDTILTSINTKITYTLYIEAVKDDGTAITFNISNKKDMKAAERQYILPEIEIYKDCFVKGTQINLIDGSKINVENLRTGDMVQCGNGAYTRISGISSIKQKQTLGYIKLENGMELRMTKGHMVMTPDGLKVFAALSPKDMVITEWDMSPISQIETTPEQEHEIFIVVLEDMHHLFANGIMTSDSAPVLTDKEQRMNERCLIPEALRQDYDAWLEMKSNTL